MEAQISTDSAKRYRVYRHTLLVRFTHWVNVVCLTVLLMSGLQIFNAHPALYWGQASDFGRPIAAIGAHNKGGIPVGVTQVFGHEFDTTGVLGLSGSPDPQQRGFPSWITLPGYQDLATGRRWHFFFAWLFVANGLLYLGTSLVGGHIWRDLVPSRIGLRGIGHSFITHLRLQFPKGQEARHYNVLQQLSYIIIAFVVLPLLVLAGLAMSPGIDTVVPELTSVFSGRQSARTIHFLAAWIVLLFVLVHVLMVILSGLWNNMRSMITGWYVIEPQKER
jgi:thiosulfate reductase cytochrome b subunit